MSVVYDGEWRQEKGVREGLNGAWAKCGATRKKMEVFGNLRLGFRAGGPKPTFFLHPNFSHTHNFSPSYATHRSAASHESQQRRGHYFRPKIEPARAGRCPRSQRPPLHNRQALLHDDVDMDDTTSSNSSSSSSCSKGSNVVIRLEGDASSRADQNDDDGNSSSRISRRYEGRARKATTRWEPEPVIYAAFAAQRRAAKKLSLLQLRKEEKEAIARKKQEAKKNKPPAAGAARSPSSLPPEPVGPPLLPLPPPDMPFVDFALPADLIQEVQSEPPPKYRLLRQNYYSDPALRPRDDDVPLCSCLAETGGCDHNCMNRQLFMECPVGRCPTLKEGERFCANMVIQERRFAATEVFLTRERGWALRTKESVGREEMLIEYMGEVVSMEEAQGRMKEMTSIHDYYFAALEGDLILDAGPMGSEARFANHSCAPNCVLQKWRAGGEPHIIVVAARKLEAGEEVTYNYQLDTTVGLFGQQVCRCGAKNCSGLIGRKPQGGGIGGGREEWRERAEACLAMRAPGLEVVEGLVEEEEGREGGGRKGEEGWS